MWNKDYKKVNGIVSIKGAKYFPEFEIDFDKLSEVTNHYNVFIDTVRENYENHKDSFKNIVVYRTEEVPAFGTQEGKIEERIFVVFDHHDTFIRLFGCNTNHVEFPYIHEFSQNKSFVSMMSKLL